MKPSGNQKKNTIYEKRPVLLFLLLRCLLNGAQLIAIHAGKYYKRSDGLALGPGCFVKGLEYSAQCKAELVGKPNEAFFKSALGGIDPKEAVMIGDVSFLVYHLTFTFFTFHSICFNDLVVCYVNCFSKFYFFTLPVVRMFLPPDILCPLCFFRNSCLHIKVWASVFFPHLFSYVYLIAVIKLFKYKS